MASFTVASGPINFGALGGDEDFFGGTDQQSANDFSSFQEDFTATAYTQPASGTLFPSPYPNAPWDPNNAPATAPQTSYPLGDVPDETNQHEQPPFPNPLYETSSVEQSPEQLPQAWAPTATELRRPPADNYASMTYDATSPQPQLDGYAPQESYAAHTSAEELSSPVGRRARRELSFSHQGTSGFAAVEPLPPPTATDAELAPVNLWTEASPSAAPFASPQPEALAIQQDYEAFQTTYQQQEQQQQQQPHHHQQQQQDGWSDDDVGFFDEVDISFKHNLQGQTDTDRISNSSVTQTHPSESPWNDSLTLDFSYSDFGEGSSVSAPTPSPLKSPFLPLASPSRQLPSTDTSAVAQGHISEAQQTVEPSLDEGYSQPSAALVEQPVDDEAKGSSELTVAARNHAAAAVSDTIHGAVERLGAALGVSAPPLPPAKGVTTNLEASPIMQRGLSAGALAPGGPSGDSIGIDSSSVSRVSSMSSTPARVSNNLEAGRRKLEEYKRRKQAVLARKQSNPGIARQVVTNSSTGASSGASPLRNARASSSAGEVYNNGASQQQQPGGQVASATAQVEAAMARAMAAEAAAAQTSQDLDRVLRQLEAVDKERTALQREKAGMVGEMMGLQAALEATQETEARLQALEKSKAELEATLQAETAERQRLVKILQAERDAAVAQREEAQQWATSLQTDSHAVKEDNQRLKTEIETALAGLNNASSVETLNEQLTAALGEVQGLAAQLEIERARGNELETALVAQAEEQQRQIGVLQAEKDAAVVQAQETAQQAEQHVAEVQNWVASVQADSQAVREANEALRAELEVALAAAETSVATASAPQAPGIDSEELAIVQAEVEGLLMQLEAERARADEYAANIASSKEDVSSLRELLAEGESERQMLQEHSAQLHTKVTELELELASLQQALQVAQQGQGYAMPAAAPEQGLFGNGDSNGDQDRAGAEPEVMLLQLELQQAAARAGAAEQQAAEAVQRAAAVAVEAEAAREELAAYIAETSNLKEELTRLHSETSSIDHRMNQPDSPQASSRRGGSNDPESLRYRLSKAEAAVEKERRTAQALERQIREAEAAAEEGRAATAAAFELRRRCDAAEREAAAAKATVEQLQSSTSVLPDANSQIMARVRMAEERAGAAESIAGDLRSQCDAAARTISKLVEENQELAERLNRQGNALVELQERAVAERPGVDDKGLPHSPFASRRDVQEVPGQHGNGHTRHSSADFRTPVPQHTQQRVWEIPGAVPVQENSQEEIQSDSESASPAYTDRGGKKKGGGGFWAWVAGADLVENYD